MTQQSEEAQPQMADLAAEWGPRIFELGRPTLDEQYRRGAYVLNADVEVDEVSAQLQEITAGNEPALDAAGHQLFRAVQAELWKAYRTARTTDVNRGDVKDFDPNGSLILHLRVTF